MKLNAYILAADPAWIEASVLSYYDHVGRIVISYDSNGLGWTGMPIDVEQCLRRLKAIDVAGKFDYLPGHFSRSDFFTRPMENDTHQRQVSLDAASEGADWVLQLDADEVLPNASRLLEVLAMAELGRHSAVEWPMRVLFRRLPDGRYLEVCGANGTSRFEYPGPIAVRPGVKLLDARRSAGSFARLVVQGDKESVQICQPPQDREERLEWLCSSDVIVHNSWARPRASIRSKISSWGHNQGWRSKWYYYRYWMASRWFWPWMRNFHPLFSGLWPALKVSTEAVQIACDADTLSR